MDNSEDLYLLFASGKYYFFIPVLWVKKVTDGSAQKDRIRTISLSGEKPDNAHPGYRYRIYLEGEGGRLAIAADRAFDIRKVEPEKLIPLGSPVINDNNKYFQAAVPVTVDEEQIMAYVLEPENLMRRENLWNI